MNTENTRILGPEEPFQEGDWVEAPAGSKYIRKAEPCWMKVCPPAVVSDAAVACACVPVYRPLSNTPETEGMKVTIEILPISKAPEDRCPLLLWCKVEECWVIGSRDAGGYAWGDNIEGDPVYPSHFAELPPPMNEPVLSIKEEV